MKRQVQRAAYHPSAESLPSCLARPPRSHLSTLFQIASVTRYTSPPTVGPEDVERACEQAGHALRQY
ncbi:MAG TPA: hypothetical protein VGV09_08940, partial [Steroidobacteraceae bacterium]|nr:hypothetical protein [Steroidobacteraceae bacterium]